MSKETQKQRDQLAKRNAFGAFILLVGVAVIVVVALSTGENANETEVDTTENANISEESVNSGVGGPDESGLEEQEVVEDEEDNQEDSVEDVDSSETAQSDEDVRVGKADHFELLQSATYTETGDISSFMFGDDNIVNVMPLEMKSIVLGETPVVSEEDIMVGDQPAKQLIISSAKDGSEITIVQAELDGTLVDVRGADDFLENLDQYIRFY